MGWIKLSGKALVYVGKLAQMEGFEEWAADTGKSVVEGLAEKSGARFFKRKLRDRYLQSVVVST